jgi:hypothetical protein
MAPPTSIGTLFEKRLTPDGLQGSQSARDNPVYHVLIEPLSSTEFQMSDGLPTYNGSVLLMGDCCR